MTAQAVRCRSLLFVPGNRLELLAKVGDGIPTWSAVDLEDAIRRTEKETARHRVAEADLSAPRCHRAGPGQPAGTPWHEVDVAAAVRQRGGRDRPPQGGGPRAWLRGPRLAEAAAGRGAPAGIETALGVSPRPRNSWTPESPAPISAPRTTSPISVAAAPPRGLEVLYARSDVVLAGAAGRGAGRSTRRWSRSRTTPPSPPTPRPAGTSASRARSASILGRWRWPTPCSRRARPRSPPPGRSSRRPRNGVGVVDGMMVDAAHVRAAQQVLRG